MLAKLNEKFRRFDTRSLDKKLKTFGAKKDRAKSVDVFGRLAVQGSEVCGSIKHSV